MADVPETPQDETALQQSTASKDVDALLSGTGELGGGVEASSSNSSTVSLQGGYRFNQNWAAYGDAWWNPSQGSLGGSAGVIWKDFTVSAGGWATPSTGEVGGQVGVGFNF